MGVWFYLGGTSRGGGLLYFAFICKNGFLAQSSSAMVAASESLMLSSMAACVIAPLIDHYRRTFIQRLQNFYGRCETQASSFLCETIASSKRLFGLNNWSGREAVASHLPSGRLDRSGRCADALLPVLVEFVCAAELFLFLLLHVSDAHAS